MNFLTTYLQAIQNISTQDKEHTYRTFLHNLMNEIKDSLAQSKPNLKTLSIIQEPNNDKEGRGAPDFMILSKGLSVGYIENKRVNADLDSIISSPQIEKYLRLNDNLMLTDYLRFTLVRAKNGGGAKSRLKICELAQINQGGNLSFYQGKSLKICELAQIKATLKDKALLESKAKDLLDFFFIFFTHEPEPINTALEFASTLALRTQILKNELLENEKNAHIQNFYSIFKTQLYDELLYEDFCDSFAQTLTYSLFLAKLNSIDNKEIDLYNVKKFIPKSFPLIRAMSDFLDKIEDLYAIKWLIDEILHIIHHIDIISIIKELNRASEKDILGHYTTQFTHKDPYLHFYETFLSKYDPRLREIRGVYYTPASVVCFIINAIDSVLKEDFSLKEGLSAALKNQNITLLDFATGTGTFLLEAFRKALESIPQNSPRYEPKKLLKQFFGFEFLIAPYTIAHLKLSQSFKEDFYTPLKDNERLGIYLTNTLYFKDTKKEQNERGQVLMGFPELVEEAINAQSTKEKPILIITGNPPYSGASSNKGLYEDEVRITYGLEPSEQHFDERQRAAIKQYLKNIESKNAKSIKSTFKAILESKKLKNEKNPKWLLDDYVKFIRFAESKIESQESGIFAFISNNSFLDNPTFRGMRYHLMNTFDKIYILDLHGNARKKEATPDGSKDDNVFDIMQGVSINIFVKNANCHSQTSPCHSKVSNCHSEALAEESKTSPCHSERALATEESLKSSLCHSKSSLEGEISPTSSPFHSEALAEESQDSTKDSKRYFANAQYDKISPQYDKINAQDNKETYHSKVSNCHSEASAEVSQTSPYHSSLSHYHSKSSLEGEISPTSPSCHSEALAEESQTDSTKDSSLALQVQNDKVKDISASPHACLTQPTHTCKDDNDKNLATLYHYDLYGKRKDKYNFLYDNSLDSVAWTKLKPKAPFYLFIPQNESLREEYNKGWSVKDIFRVSGVGITTAHDEFVIHSSKEKLLQKFEDFKNSPPDAAKLHEKFNVKEKQGWDILKGWHNLQKKSDLSQYIQKIAYRPFDNRYIFYEEKLVWRCVKDIMRHFLPLCHSEALAKESKISPCHSERSEESQTDSTKDSSLALQVQNDKVKDISASPRACLIQPTHTCKDDKENKQYSNKALLVSRQTSAIGDKEFNTAFISDKMVDINFYRRGGEQVSPLYLKDQASNTQRVENFTSKFRAFIDSKYQWDINDYQNNPEFFLSFDFENSHCHSQTSPCHSKSSLEGEVSPTSPSCHTEALAEESQTDSTKDSKRYFANAQYDKINAQDNKETYHSKVSNYHSESSPYHSEASNCHSEALAEESKTSPFHSKPSLEGEESLNKASKVSQFILTPEAILGYIYAVLFHKDYREKYIDFLKTDFPKIPFVESKEKFLALSALGRELMAVHLMQDSQIREREREREQKMMRMNCNIGLNVARQYKISGSWQCVIVTNTLVDLSLMGGGNTGAGMIFPLYLYPKAK